MFVCRNFLRVTGRLTVVALRSSDHAYTKHDRLWPISNNWIQIKRLASQTSDSIVVLDKFVKELQDRGLKEGARLYDQDVFGLFRLKRDLRIDEKKLKREYRSIMRVIHPDKYFGQSLTVEERVSSLSALVTEAYNLLLNPYERIKYLVCKRMGIDEQAIASQLERLRMDEEFLDRMMLQTEFVDELSGDKHDSFGVATTQSDEVAKMRTDLEVEVDGLIADIQKGLENSDKDAVLRLLGKLKFLGNLYARLNDMYDKLNTF